METSLFAFATDLHDEGVEAVLDNAQRRAGVDALTLAAAYHAARDVFPHGSAGKVRFLEPGAVFFRSEASRYGRLKPPPSELVSSGGDPLGELCVAAASRGLGVDAWVVFLHSDRLGFEHPDCAPSNAFGDRYLTDLCPAHPDVRAYAVALAGDVASYDVGSIRAEALQFQGLEHGFHHERYFEELGPLPTFLLGLCFCEHCVAAARRRGVDGDGVARLVAAELERALTGGVQLPDDEPTRAVVAALGGGEMGGYLAARSETVASLARDVAQAAHREGARLTFMDMAGAEKGFATGRPGGGPAAASSWRGGVDLPAVLGAVDELEAIGYAAEPDRLRLDVEAYRALCDDPQQLAVALRPMPPDCRSGANLADKVALVRELGIGQLDFYHYGFMRLRALDWIRAALDGG